MDEVNVAGSGGLYCLTRDDIVRQNALNSALEFLRVKPGATIKPLEVVVVAEEFLRFLKD